MRDTAPPDAPVFPSKCGACPNSRAPRSREIAPPFPSSAVFFVKTSVSLASTFKPFPMRASPPPFPSALFCMKVVVRILTCELEATTYNSQFSGLYLKNTLQIQTIHEI